MTQEQRKLDEEQIKNNFSHLQKKLDDLRQEIGKESDETKKQEKQAEIDKLQKDLEDIKSCIQFHQMFWSLDFSNHFWKD